MTSCLRLLKCPVEDGWMAKTSHRSGPCTKQTQRTSFLRLLSSPIMQAIKPTCLCSRHQALSSIPVSAFKSLSAVTRHAQAAPETSQRQAACYKRSVCIPLQAVGKGFGTPKPKVTDTAAVTPTSQCPCQSGKEYQVSKFDLISQA